MNTRVDRTPGSRGFLIVNLLIKVPRLNSSTYLVGALVVGDTAEREGEHALLVGIVPSHSAAASDDNRRLCCW